MISRFPVPDFTKQSPAPAPLPVLPIPVGTEMRLYTPLLCANFQGDRIWRSRFIAVFVSVRKEEEEKNEETKPIFEVAYLGNALSDFDLIWNVECWRWRECPQQKSSCFIKAAQSYGSSKIAFSFFLSIYSRVLSAGFLGRTTHYRVS